MLRFEGPVPSDDEVAAILAVLSSSNTETSRPPVTSAWKLAALLPELSFDEVRAAAQGSRYVP